MKHTITTLFAVVASAFLDLADDAFPSISTEDLKQAIAAKKVILLDVNGTESWQEGHIPGALDFDKVEGKLAKVLPADKSALVVAYCGNERCSAYKAGAHKLPAKKS